MINIYLFKLDNRSTDSLTLLRYLLAENYHLSEDAIHIHHNEYGKPSVTLSEHKDLYFSISHAKATTVIAISDTPIGIDAEYITALSPDSISHFLTEDERQYCTDSLHTLEIWTKKEAVSKYLGYGLNKLRTLQFCATSHHYFRLLPCDFRTTTDFYIVTISVLCPTKGTGIYATRTASRSVTLCVPFVSPPSCFTRITASSPYSQR